MKKKVNDQITEAAIKHSKENGEEAYHPGLRPTDPIVDYRIQKVPFTGSSKKSFSNRDKSSPCPTKVFTLPTLTSVDTERMTVTSQHLPWGGQSMTSQECKQWLNKYFFKAKPSLNDQQPLHTKRGSQGSTDNRSIYKVPSCYLKRYSSKEKALEGLHWLKSPSKISMPQGLTVSKVSENNQTPRDSRLLLNSINQSSNRLISLNNESLL